MNKLGFLLSKKILVLLSGVVFTSVAFASSGAQSLFQDSAITMPKTKIPEVQKVEESTEASSSPAPAIAKQASTKRNTPAAPKPTVKPAAVAVTVQPVVVQPAPAKTPTSLAFKEIVPFDNLIGSFTSACSGSFSVEIISSNWLADFPNIVLTNPKASPNITIAKIRTTIAFTDNDKSAFLDL